MSIIASLVTQLRRLANRRVLFLSGALSVVLGGVLFASSGPGSVGAVAEHCGQPAPDVRFTTTPDGVQSFFAECGEAGRAAYRDLQLVDLLYPAAVGIFLASAMALVLVSWTRRRGSGSALVVLAALPLAASACDYLENAAAWTLLVRSPQHVSWVASTLGAASASKQVLTWASVLVLVGSGVAALIARVRGDRPAVSLGSPVRSR